MTLDFLKDVDPNDAVGGAIATLKELKKNGAENLSSYWEVIEEIASSKKDLDPRFKEFAETELKTRLGNKASNGNTQSLEV